MIDLTTIDSTTLLKALILQNQGGLPVNDVYVDIAQNLNMTPYVDDTNTLRLSGVNDLVNKKIIGVVKQ